MSEMFKVPIRDIKIGKRFRIEMGDLAKLARGMHDKGQLQPIGITDNNELVFGARRVAAAKDLGWKEIRAVRVNLDSIVTGEFEENDNRKDFSPSEKGAIADAIAKMLGDRRENRADAAHPAILPDIESGTDTRQFAAERAGLGSATTYRNVQKVTSNGTPELQEAMDSGEVTIGDAASIAGENPAVQRAAIKAKKSGKTRTVREGAAKAKAKTSESSVPAGRRDLHKVLQELVGAVSKARRLVDVAAKLDGGDSNRFAGDARNAIRQAGNVLDAWRRSS